MGFSRNSDLGREPLVPLFLRFALPGALAMVFMAAQFVADSVIIGRLLGPAALAGVNIAGPIYTFVTAVTVIIGVGTQAQLCLKLGEGDYFTAKTSLWSGLLGVLFFCMLGAVFVNVFSDRLALLLGADAGLLPHTLGYIRGLMIFLGGIGVMMFLQYVLQGLGHPREAMAIMISSIILNVVLSLVFVAGLGMGAFGAGLGTGVSFTLGGVAMGVCVWREYRSAHSLRHSKCRFSVSRLGHIVYNGASEGMTEIALGVTTALFNITLMKMAGSDGVAAFTVLSAVMFFGISVMLGVSNGVIPVLSYNHGARKASRVRRTARFVVVTNVAVGLVMLVAVEVFARQIVPLFFEAADQGVVEMTTNGGRLMAVAFVFNGCNIFGASFFTAMDCGGTSFVIASLRSLVVLVAAILLLPKFLGIDGVWLAMPVAEAATFAATLLFLVRWGRRHWEKA